MDYHLLKSLWKLIKRLASTPFARNVLTLFLICYRLGLGYVMYKSESISSISSATAECSRLQQESIVSKHFFLKSYSLMELCNGQKESESIHSFRFPSLCGSMVKALEKRIFLKKITYGQTEWLWQRLCVRATRQALCTAIYTKESNY